MGQLFAVCISPTLWLGWVPASYTALPSAALSSGFLITAGWRRD
jgi:hypothetical protein